MVTRNVLIQTRNNSGKGNTFAHPSKPDYNNPIHAIFHHIEWARLKFETRDGIVSTHPNSEHKFLRKESSSKDAQVTKIQVWYTDAINGFKFYSNDDVVLEAGHFKCEMKKVKLEKGERLVGVRSRLDDNTPDRNSIFSSLQYGACDREINLTISFY